MKHRLLHLCVLVLAVLLLARPVTAGEPQVYTGGQGRCVEAKAIVGYSTFVNGEDGFVPHYVAGGSVRVYLTPRLSFEPEFLYMYGSKADQDFVFIPNVAFDFTEQERRVKPYVIAGVGILHHRGMFFSGNTWTPSGGIGVKVFLTDRLFVSPEVRLGWEPFLRMTVSIGYVLRRRE